MRNYQTSFNGTVDLDNPQTYEHLPSLVEELDDIMFKEIGYAICYMDYFRPEFFPNYYGVDKLHYGYQQRLRVNDLIRKFTSQRKDNYQNILWYKEIIFLFQDETENMC